MCERFFLILHIIEPLMNAVSGCYRKNTVKFEGNVKSQCTSQI